MSEVYANHDVDYELQARSLGAGRWATQRYVTLPAVFPSVVVGALFTFLISWSQYVLILLIGDGHWEWTPQTSRMRSSWKVPGGEPWERPRW